MKTQCYDFPEIHCSYTGLSTSRNGGRTSSRTTTGVLERVLDIWAQQSLAWDMLPAHLIMAGLMSMVLFMMLMTVHVMVGPVLFMKMVGLLMPALTNLLEVGKEDEVVDLSFHQIDCIQDTRETASPTVERGEWSWNNGVFRLSLRCRFSAFAKHSNH